MNILEMHDIIHDEVRDYFKRYFSSKSCPKCKASPLFKIEVYTDNEEDFEIGRVLHCVHCNTTFREKLEEVTK